MAGKKRKTVNRAVEMHILIESGRVVLRFNEDVDHIDFGPEQAVKIATAILERAKQIEEGTF